MRQFSILALLWFTAAAGIAIGANLRSRSYESVVIQHEVPMQGGAELVVTVHERGFPFSYTTWVPRYEQLFWIALNCATVFAPTYLLFRIVRLVRHRREP